ncbi:MAG: phosphonate ABC transporter substrate-binding protein [endosymbiont of Galathealinum brachiosum]|uniref:Phosphonate ABC transporter substrate-binding protein n=1 Tax=endosymbiont of Galathealinum brachiosum TaxID=2200906 RepID=A0A370DAT1_9GAMM|nr:MAG: phosphonate ABC transporter substrate-binding protein [endosymbiont of Galathealinum brachiosum]
MNKYSYLWKSVLLVVLALVLSACDNDNGASKGPQYSVKSNDQEDKTYYLAIHPLHNPKKLIQAYQPLVNYLNKNIEDVNFKLESSRDYQAFEHKFRERHPEFILPNPWQTLEAMKVGYSVIAMAGDAQDFKGIFIVRKDSLITKITDLKGKTVSYPSHTALAACIMPQYHLHERGIDVNKDINNNYVGSQESAIMNAYLKQSDVGVTWPPPWRLFQRDHPEEAAELTLVWETAPLMNNSVMVRDDIPDVLGKRVQLLLMNLKNSPDGLAVLKNMSTSKFHQANDLSYAPVREFVKNFEAKVRPVEQK